MILNKLIKALKNFGFIISFPAIVGLALYLHNSEVSIHEGKFEICQQEIKSTRNHVKNMEEIYSVTSCSKLLPEMNSQKTIYEKKIKIISDKLDSISAELEKTKLTLEEKQNLLMEKENALTEKEILIQKYETALAQAYLIKEEEIKQKYIEIKSKRNLDKNIESLKELRQIKGFKHSTKCDYKTDNTSNLYIKCSFKYSIGYRYSDDHAISISKPILILNGKKLPLLSITGDVSEEEKSKATFSFQLNKPIGFVTMEFQVPKETTSFYLPYLTLLISFGNINQLHIIGIIQDEF